MRVHFPRFGRDPAFGHFAASIDDVAIFKRALSAPGIEAIVHP